MEQDGTKRHDPPSQGESKSWYTRVILTSTVAGQRASEENRLVLVPMAPDRCQQISFELGKGDIGESRPWHHDDVPSGRGKLSLMPSEDLPHESLRTIAPDRAPQLSGGDDTEPIGFQAVGEAEHGHIPALGSAPTPLHPQELGPAPKPVSAGQAKQLKILKKKTLRHG